MISIFQNRLEVTHEGQYRTTGNPGPNRGTIVNDLRILLAGLEPQQQNSIATQYLQANMIKNSRDFLTELNTLRRQQYSAGVSSFNGTIYELSVPIYNYLNQCPGVVSVFYQNNGKRS
jgi:hypothetical protein